MDTDDPDVREQGRVAELGVESTRELQLHSAHLPPYHLAAHSRSLIAMPEAWAISLPSHLAPSYEPCVLPTK